MMKIVFYTIDILVIINLYWYNENKCWN